MKPTRPLLDVPAHGTRFRLVRARGASNECDITQYDGFVSRADGSQFALDVVLNRTDRTAERSTRVAEPPGAELGEQDGRFFDTLARAVARSASDAGRWPRWINRWRAESGD